MKGFVFAAALGSAVLLLGLKHAQHEAETAAEAMLLEVLSTNPHAPITFEAAWLSDGGDQEIKTVEEKTPFTLRLKGQIFTAMFTRKAGSGSLKVTAFRIVDGYRQMAASGEGAAVIVNKRFGRHDVATFAE